MTKTRIPYKSGPEYLSDFKIKLILALRTSEVWFISYLELP